MPKFYANAESLKDKLIGVSTFIFACIIIGLVLLDHEHCVAGGHDGHAH